MNGTRGTELPISDRYKHTYPASARVTVAGILFIISTCQYGFKGVNRILLFFFSGENKRPRRGAKRFPEFSFIYSCGPVGCRRHYTRTHFVCLSRPVSRTYVVVLYAVWNTRLFSTNARRRVNSSTPGNVSGVINFPYGFPSTAREILFIRISARGRTIIAPDDVDTM